MSSSESAGSELTITLKSSGVPTACRERRHSRTSPCAMMSNWGSVFETEVKSITPRVISNVFFCQTTVPRVTMTEPTSTGRASVPTRRNGCWVSSMRKRASMRLFDTRRFSYPCSLTSSRTFSFFASYVLTALVGLTTAMSSMDASLNSSLYRKRVSHTSPVSSGLSPFSTLPCRASLPSMPMGTSSRMRKATSLKSAYTS